MRSLRLATPLVAVALVLSCTKQTAPTETAAYAPSVSFDFSNGPASPGNSGIFRFQYEPFFFAFDQRARIFSVHGLQNTIADLCAGLHEVDLADVQQKPHSAGEINALIVDRESPVQILAFAAEPTGDFCTDFSGAPVLYSGTVAFRRIDNNQTLDGSEGGRANSFGWTSRGVLDDLVNGGQVSYSEEVRLLINPQTGEFRELVSNIRVH